ncbi:translation initiation factor IF-2-like [Moschus berezovskii]|uniref:translation initiation factor IF-2-like n=1 Tax=Moschus berezovskii TaxID=68408 RepID=UPI0024446785|nr:translation initiation factor IF-2-like [Moschus berezovskii]
MGFNGYPRLPAINQVGERARGAGRAGSGRGVEGGPGRHARAGGPARRGSGDEEGPGNPTDRPAERTTGLPAPPPAARPRPAPAAAAGDGPGSTPPGRTTPGTADAPAASVRPPGPRGAGDAGRRGHGDRPAAGRPGDPTRTRAEPTGSGCGARRGGLVGGSGRATGAPPPPASSSTRRRRRTGGGETDDGSGPRHAREARRTGARPRGAADGEERTEAGGQTDGRTERGTDGVQPPEAEATEPAAEAGWRAPPRGRRLKTAGGAGGSEPAARAHRGISPPEASQHRGGPAAHPGRRTGGTRGHCSARGRHRPTDAGGRHPREARPARSRARRGSAGGGARGTRREDRQRRGGAGEHARQRPRGRGAGAARGTGKHRGRGRATGKTSAGSHRHPHTGAVPRRPGRRPAPATRGAGPTTRPRRQGRRAVPRPSSSVHPPIRPRRIRLPSSLTPRLDIPGTRSSEAAQTVTARRHRLRLGGEGGRDRQAPPRHGCGDWGKPGPDRPGVAPPLPPPSPWARTTGAGRARARRTRNGSPHRSPDTPSGARRDPPPTRRGEARAAVGKERQHGPTAGPAHPSPPSRGGQEGEVFSAHVLWQSPRWPLRTREGRRLGGPAHGGAPRAAQALSRAGGVCGTAKPTTHTGGVCTARAGAEPAPRPPQGPSSVSLHDEGEQGRTPAPLSYRLDPPQREPTHGTHSPPRRGPEEDTGLRETTPPLGLRHLRDNLERSRGTTEEQPRGTLTHPRGARERGSGTALPTAGEAKREHLLCQEDQRAPAG